MSYSLSGIPTNASRVFFFCVSPSPPFLSITAGAILRLVLVAWAEGKTCGEGHGPGHRARRGRTGQLQGQGQPGQDRAGQEMKRLDKTGQDGAGQSRYGQGRTEKGQGREKGKTGQTGAGQGRESQDRGRGRRRDRAGWAGAGTGARAGQGRKLRNKAKGNTLVIADKAHNKKR